MTIRLAQATTYLAGRLRTRTPLGAAEYLTCRKTVREPEAYEQRVKLAATKMELYRHFFPRQYASSDAPAYSIERERELYRLINARLFPLHDPVGGPMVFHPSIPIVGIQQHNWVDGCCEFLKLQLVFRLCLVLGGAEPERWREIGLEQLPAPPVAAVGWTLFQYSCLVAGNPLRLLPMAFTLVGYRTGNAWLDVPPGYSERVEWSVQSIATLAVARTEAEQISLAVAGLNLWLEADHPARIRQAVAIWDKAAALESNRGMEGLYV